MPARADEGGVAFWLSGQYASLAAVPPAPGWELTLTPYYYNGTTDSQTTFSRGRALATEQKTHSSSFSAQLGYTPETRFLGGLATVSLSWGLGNNATAANISVEHLPAGTPRTQADSVNGGSDLYPMATLSWNKGNDNWMVYVTGDVPTGAYNPQRLSTIGIGHGAIDAGGGYTYMNEKTGLEFSAVAGVTYNWKNPDTNYRNGIDSHLDWALSQFLSRQWEVGVVGYAYYQLTNDSYPTEGPAGELRKRVLGGFKSRVAAIGPELGYVFKLGGQSAYFNVRGYYELWAKNRFEGYALFATFNLPLGP